MSLFDNLKKVGEKALKDITSEETKEKAKNLFDSAVETGKKAYDELTTEENKAKAKAFLNSVGEKIGEATDSVKNYVNDAINDGEEKPSEEEVITVYTEEVSDETPCEEKILKVLSEQFPEYTVRTNVSPREFGGEGNFMDYSIACFKDDEPKLFIMLIGKTTCSHRVYRWSKQFAEGMGVNMINFIVHYPNELNYIATRLHNYL